MRINYVDWGMANRFSDFIEINKNLKKYPHLLEPILEHELQHTDSIISKKDLKIDFLERQPFLLDRIKFMIKYPKSLIQFLPIYYTRKHGFIYDVNMILMYSFFIFIISISIIIGLKL